MRRFMNWLLKFFGRRQEVDPKAHEEFEDFYWGRKP